MIKNNNYFDVDVIIPVYNGELYIQEAINSLLNQTYLPKRIIVIDDGSNDTTSILIKSYNKTKVKIEYYYKPNGGLSSARNFGISKSTSPYIAFLDADDRFEPTKLEEQYKVFKNSDIAHLGVVYCDFYLMDFEGKRLPDSARYRLEPNMRGNIYEKLLDKNSVASSGSGVMVKRECFDKVGVFDETFNTSEDWDMWLRIAKEYNFDYASKELVGIRRHKNNMSSDTKNMFVGFIKTLNKQTDQLLTYTPRFHSPGNYAYAPLILIMIKNIHNWSFQKAIYHAMSPNLKRHFIRQFPFVTTELFLKSFGVVFRAISRRVKK